MSIGYQRLDRKVVDYDMWFIDDERRIGLRGPRIQFEGTDYICCIGAAQTFGRFVARPFAMQLGDFLDRRCLNLGFSGAGPEFFLKKPVLMDIIRKAAVLIIQSMSARSVSAGIFQAHRNNNGLLTFLAGPHTGESLLAQRAYQILRCEYGEDAYREQIAAVQQQWVALHRELIAQTTGRTYFVWLSRKKIGDNLDLSHSVLGTFPHFITPQMVAEMETLCDGFIDCTLESMRAQPLINDRTGELEEVFTAERFPDRPAAYRALNDYYFTPRLHDFATRRIIGKLLESDGILERPMHGGGLRL